MPNIVTFFDDFEQLDDVKDELGEKAAGIIRLYQLELPVPYGFIIKSNAYKSFLTANGIYDKIVELCHSAAVIDDDHLHQLGESIRALIRSTQLQPSLQEQLGAAFQRMSDQQCKKNMAVRSSIMTNHTPVDYDVDTYLNINQLKPFFAAIQNCWASLWNNRALQARYQAEWPLYDTDMAIIVQEMIDAEVSGVLYTSNPVSGNNAEMVIDACWGLGEGAAQGRTDSDNYIIDKYSFSVHEMIGQKEVMIVPDYMRGEGTVEVILPREKQNISSISEDQITKLITVGLDIEAMVGINQEIEWAWSNGQLYILQHKTMNSLF